MLVSENFNVIILKRSFSDIYRISELLNTNKVKSYDIDIVNIEEVFQKHKIDIIIHCATNYGRTSYSCHKVLETNLIFPVMLLDYAVKYNVLGFINTDSYFNKDDNLYSYLLNYSLSKKNLIQWLKYFSKKIKIVNMMLEHVYGEDDNKEKFVFQMIDNISVKQIKSIDLTYGEQKRDFIYVDDVADAYLKIINYIKQHSFKYKSFEVGTGQAVKIKDFVYEIKKISNSPTILNFGAIPYREDEMMYSCAEVEELNDIGWFPKYSYKQALKKILLNQQCFNQSFKYGG